MPGATPTSGPGVPCKAALGWAPDTQALVLARPCPPALPPRSPLQKQLGLTVLTECKSPSRKRWGGMRKEAGGERPGGAQKERWSGPVPHSPGRHSWSEVGKWGAGDKATGQWGAPQAPRAGLTT